MAKRFPRPSPRPRPSGSQKDGTISGAVSGTWEQRPGSGVCHVDGKRYSGVFTRQWEPESAELCDDLQRAVEAGRSIWGSRIQEKTDRQAVADVERDLNWAIPAASLRI